MEGGEELVTQEAATRGDPSQLLREQVSHQAGAKHIRQRSPHGWQFLQHSNVPYNMLHP